jgi:hypothetical protein
MAAEYKTQVASDIIRDGLGIELLNERGEVVAEVFRCDKDKTVIVSTFSNGIPLAALEIMLERAKVRLEPFEDGTPLSDAKNPVLK